MTHERGSRRNFGPWAIAALAVPIAIDATMQLTERTGLRQRSDTMEISKALATVAEQNHRLLVDLHTGIAPRDGDLIPQWAGVRHALAENTHQLVELRRTIEQNTRAAKELGFELEDRRHFAPADGSAMAESQEPPSYLITQEPTRLDRLLAWLRGDAEE